jgi:hypothetical protein
VLHPKSKPLLQQNGCDPVALQRARVPFQKASYGGVPVNAIVQVQLSEPASTVSVGANAFTMKAGPTAVAALRRGLSGYDVLA